MLYFLIGIIIIAVDLFTKVMARMYLSEIGTIALIKNIFHLTYVENTGAAFGILKEKRVFFVVIAVVVVAAIIYVAMKYKNKPPVLNCALSFLYAGAVGNTIDRVYLGFVVDFFDFRLINFPVFNVADIFVCIGAGLLVIYFIFFEEKYSGKGEQAKNED